MNPECCRQRLARCLGQQCSCVTVKWDSKAAGGRPSATCRVPTGESSTAKLPLGWYYLIENRDCLSAGLIFHLENFASVVVATSGGSAQKVSVMIHNQATGGEMVSAAREIIENSELAVWS